MKTYRFRRSNNLLTNRERQVVELIVNEYNTVEIANHLYLSVETIKSHRRSIMTKLDVRNVAGIVREAILREYIHIGNRAYAS